MGFTIDDAIALLNGGLTDGLSEMTLARAGWAEEQAVLMLLLSCGGLYHARDGMTL